jgi:DNA gyrase subunit A
MQQAGFEFGHRIPVNIEDEMRRSYIDYAMSVIVGRALPDVRDGLKPVHRRILYAMFREGLLHNKKYSKCAGVVGEVIKKFHPHGDAAVYDALVRMAQDFNLRYPLIDGQGNFGSIDGDPPAAYRYTEARLTKLAEAMLADIDKDTVDFAPNFDESHEEPKVLPSVVPNLLVNGSSGIAVGMATNIPPHNLGEVVDALLLMLDNPQASVRELLEVLPGPDFPTGAFIHGHKGIFDAFAKGRGLIQMRAKAFVEKQKSGKESIIVTELPYQVNKAKLVERIAELVRNKVIEGVADLRDESDREGMRIFIELKREEDHRLVLNQLYKHTAMQSTMGIIMLALVNNQPRILNLPKLLSHFLAHRREVILLRTRHDLRKAQERAHILEGLKIALDQIDAVIALIRAAKIPEEAKKGLVTKFSLTEVQAQAILEMRLQRLTGLERQKILDELAELEKLITALTALLASEELLKQEIKSELAALKQEFGDNRRTQIVEEAKDLVLEDLLKDEEMVVSFSRDGYIKRLPLTVYRAQRRGGKGLVGMTTKEEDVVEHLFVASTHDYLLFFTNRGKAHWLKVHELPQLGRGAKGKAIVNLLSLQAEESISSFLPVRTFNEGRYLVMATKKGVIKKTELSAFSNPKRGGIIALNLNQGDELVAVCLTDGSKNLLLGTHQGQLLRFSETSVRPMGRTAAGVRGMRMKGQDYVIGMSVVEEGTDVLVVSEKGFGKRTDTTLFRTKGRAGQGIVGIKVNERTGPVVGLLQVKESDQVLLMSAEGMVVRIKAAEVPIKGRSAMGVHLQNLHAEDKVAAVAKVREEEEVVEEKDQ